MPFIPAFTLRLNNTVLPGKCTVGHFDGTNPSVACATSGGKVLIHSPHQSRLDESEDDIRFLNINQRVTSISAGRLNPEIDRDMLCVGTETNLLGYDVEENSDILYKEVADGIYSVLLGCLGDIKVPMAIVGGNGAIQGYDHQGEELYWTVTGDNVTALALCDVEGDGVHELLVGSEDYEIRIFQNEEVISEITETNRIQALCPVEGMKYGYALANGTVGLYKKTVREWRHKTKNIPDALASFDLDSDGQKEILVGWSDGTLEVRHAETGDVIFKDTFPNACAGLVEADYRNDGAPQIVCCATDGEIRGYRPLSKTDGPASSLMGKSVDETRLQKLNEEKQDILRELHTYTTNVEKVKKDGPNAGLIPTNTRVIVEVEANLENQSIELVVHTNNDTVVKVAVIFADQIFHGESLVVHPLNPPRELRIPLPHPVKDLAVEMKVKAIVGYKSADCFHVFEETAVLPTFSMFLPLTQPAMSEPPAGVVFAVKERTQRVLLWLKSSFVPPEDGFPDAVDGNITAWFMSLRDRKPLVFKFFEAKNEVHVKTESIETAGDIVQDLASYLKIEELESQAEFPSEMSAFQRVLDSVAEYNVTRQKLTAEMADSSNLIKTLVVKAEDARLLGQVKSMKKIYTSLYDVNRDLVREYIKRANNHRELLACLKEVNQMIEKASRLRVGNASARVITQCREAVRRNNIQQIFKVVAVGSS